MRRHNKILFTFLAAVAFFICTEVLLRTFGVDRASEERFYQDIFDPLTLMLPGAANPYTDIVDFMNSRGLRGPDFNNEKAPGVGRIVCLGDSTTFGMGDLNNSYPKVLEELLNGGRASRAWEVINAGIPGTNLFQQRLHFTALFKDAHPDIVLLMTGPNGRRDLKRYRDRMKKPFFRALAATQGVLKRSSLYRFLRLRIKSRSAKRTGDSNLKRELPLPKSVAMADYKEDLAGMRDLSAQWGFKLIFLPSIDLHYIERLRESNLHSDDEYYAIIAFQMHLDQELPAFAKNWKIPLIDISRDFVGLDPATKDLWHDPNHAGNLGNRLIAARVASELCRLKLVGCP